MTSISVGPIDWAEIGSQDWTVLGLAAAVSLAILFYGVKKGDRYSTTLGITGAVAIAALAMYLASQTDGSDSQAVKDAKAEAKVAQEELQHCEARMDSLHELIQSKLDRTTTAEAAHAIGAQMQKILEREGCGSRND